MEIEQLSDEEETEEPGGCKEETEEQEESEDSNGDEERPQTKSQKTRFSFQKLMLPFRSTNRGLRTLGYLGPRLWNGLHTELKSSSSVNNFKHKIKNNFFALLGF